jgi:two-component system NtrC family sensor kinase
MAVRSSLSLRLSFRLLGVVVLAFGGYAVLDARITARQWEENLEAWALKISNVIKDSTHHSMLLNRKEDVPYIIEAIAGEPGVEGVRIYDKEGVIIVSADAAEVGARADLHAEACVVCHAAGEPLGAVPEDRRARVYRDADGRRVLGLINPIANSPACATADCHAHAPETTVLGVLDVKVSLAEADARLAATRRLSLSAAVVIALAVGLVSAAFIDRTVRRPVRGLIAGTERIAQGDLEAEIPASGGDEVGRLAEAFNRMTADLRKARRENEEWSRKLERKVVDKTEELSRAQRQVIHMEKMASLGKLAATVAHELNNPLAGILNYARLVERSLAEGDGGLEEREEMARSLSVIQQESRRCGEIVRNLLAFSRRSGAELARHHLHAVVERALLIVRHLLEMSRIEVVTDLAAGDDELVCDADQLQQALVALLVNAAEAMPEGGTLTVATREADGRLELAVTDTGVGIPPEHLPHIFEPFFSSKKETSGAGLGLAVVYGIVRRHGAEIEVDSAVGRGTTFRLLLPRRPPAEGSAET